MPREFNDVLPDISFGSAEPRIEELPETDDQDDDTDEPTDDVIELLGFDPTEEEDV